MSEKSTNELINALGKTHIADFENFHAENKYSMSTERESFYVYVRRLLAQKGLTQQVVFLKADIPERYGYKLLSGEKKTRQRDIILRICYAAEMTLDEVQRCLRKYEMPELYVKNPRDAFIMIAINERPGSIITVNELLKGHGFDTLKTSGVQD